MTILRTGLGVGDVLLATGVLRALHRVYQRRYIVETRFPALFYHNPFVRAIWQDDRRTKVMKRTFDHPIIWRAGSLLTEWFDRKIIKPTYPFPCRQRHIIDAMAESVGVQLLPEERRPFIYLTKEEREAQSWAKGWIAVQSSSTSYWTVNKDWAPGRMQEVVDELRAEGFSIVHLGSAEDDALNNVKDMRGENTLRTIAAILANVALLVGPEGGLVHLARAVNTKSVVIYTGYTQPEETGYEDNINLRDPNAGEGCWRREKCEECEQSANNVQVEHVIQSALRLLDPATPTSLVQAS